MLRYVDAANRLDAFLSAKGMPRVLANIRREHVEAFMEDLLARFKPATPRATTNALQQNSGMMMTTFADPDGNYFS